MWYEDAIAVHVAGRGARLLHATTFYVTVAGLGGEPEYEQRFSGWAKDIDKLRTRRRSRCQGRDALSAPAATRAKVQSVLQQIAKEAKPNDALVLMLIGHGTSTAPITSSTCRVRIFRQRTGLAAGPDSSRPAVGGEHDQRQRRLAVPHWRKPNRAVITATKTGTEKNATVFARYWVEALRDPAADTDKNEIVSALEAFRYAEQKTAKFYETQKRLATEHPMLEDTGKGEGTQESLRRERRRLAGGADPVVRIGSAAGGGVNSGEAEAAGAQGRSGAADRHAEISKSGDAGRPIQAADGRAAAGTGKDAGGVG